LKRIVAITGNSLLLIAAVAFTWCGASLLRAHIEQVRASRVLNRKASVHSSGQRALNDAQLDGPLGTIDIPRIGVSSVILEGTDKRTLALSMGHIPGTARPGSDGNVALAAHRDTFFRGLEDIQVGDGILLTSIGGDRTYQVDSMHIVDPTDAYVLREAGTAMLTLVTCYPFHYLGPAPKRFIVQAHLLRRLLPAGG
jgi:LPXTG-site transpeptidase (sortase) family protein